MNSDTRKMIDKVKNLNQSKPKFIVDDNYFKLYLGIILISESGFTIEQPDKWFDEKYVTLYDLRTIENYQGKGYAEILLNNIFDYVSSKLTINIITLIVYKNNYKAINLYSKCGFNTFINYDDSLSLVKYLKIIIK